MISVVIPIYQSEETIVKCVESIIAQSFEDWELVLIDDGSSDHSGRLCDSMAADDDRITVVHQPNMGRTAARHNGVKRAKGEWLCFVDSDDRLPANSLRDLFSLATDDVDIVLGNGYTLTNETRSQIPMSDFRHLAVRGEGTIGVPWGSLYRRSILSDYLFDLPRDIINGEDYIFWLRLVFSTDKPVSVIYNNVYDKGDEHTSNSFVWTSDYAARLQHFRLQSIPESQRKSYLEDTLADRIANLFDIAVWSPRHEWAGSEFLNDIFSDMKQCNCRLTLKQRLFLNLPSLRLRRMISCIMQRKKKTNNRFHSYSE